MPIKSSKSNANSPLIPASCILNHLCIRTISRSSIFPIFLKNYFYVEKNIMRKGDVGKGRFNSSYAYIRAQLRVRKFLLSGASLLSGLNKPSKRSEYVHKEVLV